MSSLPVPYNPRLALSPAQCRAARALLDWTLDDAAEKAKVGRNTIFVFERGRSLPQAATIAALRACFEAQGIAFFTEPGREGVSRLL